MKKMICVACLLALVRLGGLTLVLAAMAATDPIWVTDGLQSGGGTYRDVCVLNDSSGWAVGDNGVVAKREGKLYPLPSDQVWVSKPVISGQISYDFRGVCFANANNGWIVGYKNWAPKKYMGVVLRTEDGGANWTQTFSNMILVGTPDSLTPFLKVKVNRYGLDYRGYISCGNGYILKLELNGSWTPMRPPAPNNDSISVWYKDLWMNSLDPNQVWALGDNSCMFAGSTNGGTSWNFEYPPFGQEYHFPDNTDTATIHPHLANLSMYGNSYNDIYSSLNYGTVAQSQAGCWSTSYFGVPNGVNGNDNWNYGITKGLGDTLFVCGNAGAIRRMAGGAMTNEKTDKGEVRYGLNFAPGSSQAYAVGNDNSYKGVQHRYDPADIKNISVQRVGDSVVVTWTSIFEQSASLKNYNVRYGGQLAQGTGAGISVSPGGGGTTYTCKHSLPWGHGLYLRNYYYWIEVEAKDGGKKWYGPISGIADSCLSGAPSVLSDISAQDLPGDQGDTIILSWSDADIVIGYDICRAESPGGPYTSIGGVGYNTTGSYVYKDGKVPQKDVPYYYIIQKYIGGPSSYHPPSAPVWAIARDNLAPVTLQRPTGSYDAITKCMTLTWAPSTAADLGGYWVCPEPVGEFACDLPPDGMPKTYHVSHSSPLERTQWNWRVPDQYAGKTLIFSVTSMDRSGNIANWSLPAQINTKVLTNSTSPQATSYNNGRKLLYDKEGNLHLAYVSNDSILYQTSWDDGYSWTPSSGVAAGGAEASCALSINGNDTVIVWCAKETPNSSVLMAARKSGVNWDTLTIGRKKAGATATNYYGPPGIEVRGGIVHAAFETRYHEYSYPPFPPLPGQIPIPMVEDWAANYLSFSTALFGLPHGQFAQPKVLDSTHWELPPFPRPLTSSSLCLDNRNNIHAVWSNGGEIYWQMYNQNTGLWKPGKTNISNSPDKTSSEPSLSFYGDVHLVWEEDYDICHIKGNYGLPRDKTILPYQPAFNWGEAENISNNPSTASRYPVFDGGYAAWSEETKPEQYNAYIASCDGLTWSAPRDFSKNPTQPSLYPQIACRQISDGSKMTTVWTEGTGPLYSLIARDEAGQVTPQFAADVGWSSPSIYTIERDSCLTYGNGVTVDYDTTELQYYLPTLLQDQKQDVEIVLYQENPSGERFQYKLYVDDVPLGTIEVPSGQPVLVDKQIPNSVTHDGDGVLRIEKTRGSFVTCDKWQMFTGDRGGVKASKPIANKANKPVIYVNELKQNAPNPSSGKTQFRYQMAEPGRVTLTVYNNLGQTVKTVVDCEQQPGVYSVAWDGKDGFGRQVANGIYFYRINAGRYSDTKKMVMMK